MAVEKELIKGINLMMQGNEAGFNTLYSYTYNYVYGRARMIMKDEQDALDLTQETYIQAYKHIHTLEDVNNIYAWLGGIVYRSGMKIFRKKRDVLVNEDAEGIFENVVSEDKDFRPEVTAEEKATSNIIMSMIDELPELQKAAILAFYYDNMKIDDIAEMFDCSSNTIKSRLNYAKKFLKDRVEMHEKKYAYKLHSLSPAVLFLALRSLLAGETYTMSAAVAQGVYNASCSMLGFVPTAIAAAGGAGASVSMSVFAEDEAGASAAGTASAGAAGSTTAAGATATSTTAGASATAGTATAASATTAAAAAATATSTGMALGTKVVIGLAVVATAGTVTVGGVAVANNGGFDNLFGQETIVDVDDEDEDDDYEEEVVIEETETETAEEVVLASYSDVVNAMSSPEYMAENSSYEELAKEMGDLVVIVTGAGSCDDMAEMSANSMAAFNWRIMNNGGIVMDAYSNAGGQLDDSAENVERFLMCFYEGAKLTEHPWGGYTIEDGQYIHQYADGEVTNAFNEYTVYEMDGYLMLEADVYEGLHEYDEPIYQYHAKILFKITEDAPLKLQVVHVQTTN